MKATLDPKADYVVKNGKRTAVILPIEEYEELLQDLDDLAVIARRKDEPTIALAEVKKICADLMRVARPSLPI